MKLLEEQADYVVEYVCSGCMCGHAYVHAYAHLVVTFVAKWWHFVGAKSFDCLWSNVVV